MKIIIEVQTPDPDIVRRALETEIKSSPYRKTRVSLKMEENAVIVEIETDEIRALRGTFNSCMNWLITALESLSI